MSGFKLRLAADRSFLFNPMREINKYQHDLPRGHCRLGTISAKLYNSIQLDAKPLIIII